MLSIFWATKNPNNNFVRNNILKYIHSIYTNSSVGFKFIAFLGTLNCTVKSEFNVEIPRLFLCFILLRPMCLNRRSVSALPWGITRRGFASFANGVAILSSQAVFDLADCMPILPKSSGSAGIFLHRPG